MSPSGMLRRVALVRTDVSEELSDSFIRVTRIGELGTTLAVTSNRLTTDIPEDSILHSLSNVKTWDMPLQSRFTIAVKWAFV
jgi:hypothetical protein